MTPRNDCQDEQFNAADPFLTAGQSQRQPGLEEAITQQAGAAANPGRCILSSGHAPSLTLCAATLQTELARLVSAMRAKGYPKARGDLHLSKSAGLEFYLLTEMYGLAGYAFRINNRWDNYAFVPIDATSADAAIAAMREYPYRDPALSEFDAPLVLDSEVK